MKQAVTHIRESRRFESMYTLQGKTRSTCHVCFPCQSTYTQCMLPVGSPRMWQPFMSRRQSWTESLLLRIRAPDTIHCMPADRSMSLYPVSLPSQPIKQWRKPNICRHQATRLTGPISPVCDRYVQYLLMGSTHRSLTDTGGGYNLGGAGFPQTTLWPSRPTVSTFHRGAPPSLRLSIQQLSIKLNRM
jgi:hypothetical protein